MMQLSAGVYMLRNEIAQSQLVKGSLDHFIDSSNLFMYAACQLSHVSDKYASAYIMHACAVFINRS